MSGLFGGTGVENNKSSTSNSSTTTNQQDNRVVAGDGAVVLGQDAAYSVDNSFGLTSTSTNSTNTSNSGNWDWASTNTSQDDNSLNVSSTTNNSGGNWDWNATTSTDSHDTYTLSDSGAMTTASAIAATNAEFLGHAAETQGDTLQFIAQMSADQLAATGDNMSEMFTYGADQNRQAWESTLNASQGLIGQMLGQAAATTASAKEIAQAAISSFTPTDNKNSDTMRWAVIGGLAFLAWKVIK